MLLKTEEKVTSFISQSSNDYPLATLSISGIFIGARAFYIFLLIIVLFNGVRNLSKRIKQQKIN